MLSQIYFIYLFLQMAVENILENAVQKILQKAEAQWLKLRSLPSLPLQPPLLGYVVNMGSIPHSLTLACFCSCT